MNRLIPLGGFILSIILNYIMGLGVKMGGLVIFFEVCGWGSFAWYALAFIPDGRDGAWAALTICC